MQEIKIQPLPPGPWTEEPDRVEFAHAGLPCLILRSRMGFLCGYAAVPPGHPWHGKAYDDIDGEIDVHGGLTYSAPCFGEICHKPAPGQPDNVWWFGFDCGHAGDLAPAIDGMFLEMYEAGVLHKPRSRRPWEVYRDITYVRWQVQALADQLQAHAK